jgi:sodium/potassium-transporting ATPase subunit alpha
MALPITYRTLSIEVYENLQQKQNAIRRAKDKAAVGELRALSFPKASLPHWPMCWLDGNRSNISTTDLADLKWHSLTLDDLCVQLSTDIVYGLSDDQVRRRSAEHDPNKLSRPPSGLFGKIMGYFFGGFGSILAIAGILVFIAWKPLGNPPAVANLALACVLIAVFVIQAAFNAWQDWSSSRVMASIGNMLPDQCIVVRKGTQTSISAMELVPGDIVVIKSGNKLPADLRFVNASNDAMFDRAILTGKLITRPSCPVQLCIQSRANVTFLCNQAKPDPFLQQSTPLKKITSKHTTLGFKARSPCPVPV